MMDDGGSQPGFVLEPPLTIMTLWGQQLCGKLETLDSSLPPEWNIQHSNFSPRTENGKWAQVPPLTKKLLAMDTAARGS